MLDEAGAWDHLHAELDDLDPTDVTALARKGKRARQIVYGAGLPDGPADSGRSSNCQAAKARCTAQAGWSKERGGAGSRCDRWGVPAPLPPG